MKQHASSGAVLPLTLPRLVADLLALAKGELTVLAMLTAVAGFVLASEGFPDGRRLLALVAGTALVGGAAGALNQYLERHHDARMERTRRRPIPAGRVPPAPVLAGGLLAGCAGTLLLWWLLNPLTGFLAGATLVIYLLLYTPLKRVSPTATLIGAIPGALPPVMGWTAARGDLSPGALSLFILLFVWQIPHFLSLAWTYRRDYAEAGFRMLTVGDTFGSRTSIQILLYTLLLLPSAVLAGYLLQLGWGFLAGAGLLWIPMLVMALRYRRERSGQAARQLFLGTITYLPAVLIVALLSKAL